MDEEEQEEKRSRTRSRLVPIIAVVGLVLVIAAFMMNDASTNNDDPEKAAGFCRAFRSAAGPFGDIDNMDLSEPSSVDAAIAEFDALVAVAPSEIADDAHATADVWRRVLSSLSGTVPKARQEILDGYRQDFVDIAPAASRMNDYAAVNCSSIPTAGPSEPTPTPTPLVIEG